MSLGASKAIASKSFVCGLPRIQYAQMRFAMSCSLKKRRFLSATSAAASSRASAGTRSVAKAQTRFTRFCALKDPSATALPSGASKTILATWSKSLTALSRPSGSWSHQSDLAKAQTKLESDCGCSLESTLRFGNVSAMASNNAGAGNPAVAKAHAMFEKSWWLNHWTCFCASSATASKSCWWNSPRWPQDEKAQSMFDMSCGLNPAILPGAAAAMAS
mmetsp:Transcript_6473/g.20797  ORF Transcript_6473/g.20797 Transcript_6473/m.20797 type:complete len:218 (-) Transcript_6473:1088-1741(-)